MNFMGGKNKNKMKTQPSPNPPHKTSPINKVNEFEGVGGSSPKQTGYFSASLGFAKKSK